MAVQITIRDVSKETRDVLKARAARQGKSMQEYLRGELEQMAARPTMDEVLDRIRARKRAHPRHISAKVIVDAIKADRR
jgi:hypothetical protein